MCNANEVFDIIYDQEHPDECKLDLYMPNTQKPCPVLVYFHGGGLEAGDRKTGEIEAIKRLVQDGISVISADYRMYPNAHFPDFLEDAAKAFSWAFNYRNGDFHFSQFFLGGASAGGYISMMLYFDSKYLVKYNISPNMISGYIFDAGQPTVHFNVLRERKDDSRAIRVDEAAPIYFINKTVDSPENSPRIMILTAENDIPCRLEQTQLMLKTMEGFGYDMSRITFKIMQGYGHCEYIGSLDENGEYIYYHLVRDFILNK